jgi:hypothetical protein
VNGSSKYLAPDWSAPNLSLLPKKKSIGTSLHVGHNIVMGISGIAINHHDFDAEIRTWLPCLEASAG